MDLAVERSVEKVLLIVITSDRGLAGAYNANIIKLAKTVIREKYSAQAAKGNVTIWSMAKKVTNTSPRIIIRLPIRIKTCSST